ncbi:MAG: hypothetical protein HQL53_06085 [Magnetococcales bacterium]|nr:hypothetical protein [Magnetococcales bacterium]
MPKPSSPQSIDTVADWAMNLAETAMNNLTHDDLDRLQDTVQADMIAYAEGLKSLGNLFIYSEGLTPASDYAALGGLLNRIGGSMSSLIGVEEKIRMVQARTGR